MASRRLLALPLTVALFACGGGGKGAADAGYPADAGPRTSRSLAFSADGGSLWVTNAESDSISEIDLAGRTLKSEVLLALKPPAVDGAGRYEPALRPRAIAVVGDIGFVAAQSSNSVLAVQLKTGTTIKVIATGAEPVSVVASADGARVYVVNHQAATVQAIDTATYAVIATLSIGEHPWGASLSADGKTLFVSHLLLHPGLSLIDASKLTLTSFTALPDQPPDASKNKLVPNGQARGAYSIVPNPITGQLWMPHLLLATGTPQPALDFQSTVFPTITLFQPGGAQVDRRLLFRPSSVPSFAGAFTDSVSGPRDVAFTPDGALALVAMAQSEDVMVFDAATGFQVALVRPTPSALLEGILVNSTGTEAYLHGRVSHDVTVLKIAKGAAGAKVTVEGDRIETLSSDPMPADLRHGMRLFYSANSAAFPVTQDFWVACSSCHLEGQSDAVTWQFNQGPRDTPSNAGGPINTGFLFRQAVRNDVIDYDETIRVEQGGHYRRDVPSQLPDLQALAKFTNYAIPFPQNPNRNADAATLASQSRGEKLFNARCTSCHSGNYLTDSGSGNPTLDPSGPVLLHDIGTCATTGPFPDKPAADIAGNPRAACAFDTPTLRGIFATAPYFHDGSAATLEEVIARVPNTSDLSATDRADLVNHLKTL